MKFFYKQLVQITGIVLVLMLLITTQGLANNLNMSLNYNISEKFIKTNKNIFELHKQKKLTLPEFNVKGIYVTGWVAGIPNRMDKLINLVDETELNSMVVDVKDALGYLSYESSVARSKNFRANKNKIRNINSLLEKLNKKGIHTIARIAVFKDAFLANNFPQYALQIRKKVSIKDRRLMEEDNKEIREYQKNITDSTKNLNSNSQPQLSSDTNKHRIETYSSTSWVNPANQEVWEYNIKLAQEAFELGFDEVQFDYIRFPALRDNKSAVTKQRSKQSIINDFISTAYKQLAKFEKPISIDVFGLTTSVNNDLGIGQNFSQLGKYANIISPMVYPSHYSRGTLGVANPAANPYEIVYQSMVDAKKKVDKNVMIRPWLQDFSLKHKYSASEVKSQINAVESLGIKEWLLWNPRSKYTREALKSNK